MEEVRMRVIARLHTDFPEKFGIPRQAGLVEQLQSTLVFEPPYRSMEALRGLEEFSHLWLLWAFSANRRHSAPPEDAPAAESPPADWSPTVRPPRLGGNRRMGVFATRSPFRPNPIGLSAVRLERIEAHPDLGPVLHLLGADLMDGTPILDIKPYIPYADCIPAAGGGFTETQPRRLLQLDDPRGLLGCLPEAKRGALLGVLQQDPRPAYQADPQRVYGLRFGPWDVHFTVCGDRLTLLQLREAETKPEENG